MLEAAKFVVTEYLSGIVYHPLSLYPLLYSIITLLFLYFLPLLKSS